MLGSLIECAVCTEMGSLFKTETDNLPFHVWKSARKGSKLIIFLPVGSRCLALLFWKKKKKGRFGSCLDKMVFWVLAIFSLIDLAPGSSSLQLIGS